MKTRVTTYKIALHDWVDGEFRMVNQEPLGMFAGIEYVDPLEAERQAKDVACLLRIPQRKVSVRTVDHEVVVQAVAGRGSSTPHTYIIAIQEGPSIYFVWVRAVGEDMQVLQADGLPDWLVHDDVLKVQAFRDEIPKARLAAMVG